MTTTQEMPGRGRRTATANGGGPPQTLAREHALLMGQVALRARDVLTATAGGQWPAQELRALAGYLRAELLRHAEDEEWLLFHASPAPAGLARLVRDHVRLRAHVEALERAADGTGTHSRAEVAGLTRDLLAQLQRHMAVEETVLASGTSGTVPAGTPPGTMSTVGSHEARRPQLHAPPSGAARR